MATNSFGYLKKSMDVDALTVAGRPMSMVLVGDSGVMNSTIGVHPIFAAGTTKPLVLPAGYTVYRTDVRVVSAPDSAAHTATVSLGTNLADSCFNTATVVTNFPLTDSLIIGNVLTNHTTSTKAAETVTYTVATQALNAGRVMVYLNIFAA